MRSMRRLVLLTALAAGPWLLAAPRPALAQAGAPVTSTQTWPAANPSDVASIDAIMEALYDVISGPAGQARDWDRFKSLFIPEARLIPSGQGPNGQVGYQVWSPDEYAAAAGAQLEANGFFEVEIARRTERFGTVAHSFSTYESRSNADDPDPFSRGINSIQLLHDGERWRIVTIFWNAERPDLTIPDAYLPGD